MVCLITSYTTLGPATVGRQKHTVRPFEAKEYERLDVKPFKVRVFSYMWPGEFFTRNLFYYGFIFSPLRVSFAF